MNAWLLAAAVLIPGGLGPCLLAASRGRPHERLAGLSLAGSLGCVVLLLLAQGFGRTSYVDLGLILAVLSPAGVLVFARFLGGRSGRRDALRADGPDTGGTGG